MTPGEAAFPVAPLDTQQAVARRRAALQRWRKRSQVIRFYRRALPAAMAVILVALGGWIALRGVLVKLGDLRNAVGTIHMTNARFYGRDGEGRPYVLAANEASRYDSDLKQVVLKGPAISFDSGGGGSNRLNADWGVYREDDRLLRLWGSVVLADASGDVFRTGQAVVDTVRGDVSGASQVRGSGPTGSVTADSFAVYDKGQRVLFRGHVHSQLKHG